MDRRRRVIVWCSLAALSALASTLIPILLRFERVEATVTRGESYSALFWDEPIDFRYSTRRVTYDVRGVNAPQSLYLTWIGGPGSTLPIYCNDWFPRWWRWDGPPQGIVQRCDAFIGLSLVFVLLIVRDATVKGRASQGK
jgi:hypothetical protein